MSTLHIALLFGFICIGLWPIRHDVAAAICALYMLVWCDLVCSALILSSIGQLGNRIAYITVSTALAIILSKLTWRMSIKAVSAAADCIKEESNLDKWSRKIAWLAIFAVIVPTSLICIFYISNNYDSISYRFPRAMLYVGQGSLSQIPADIRMAFYPFNISLVYIWFAMHGLAGVWFNLFGFITWLIGGIAVWRFSRDIGAKKTPALIASAIFITCPAVLVSASSTNDDMIAGVPFLMGIMFLIRWWKSSHWFDVMLAAIGFGLALGSKLHWVMMLPMAAILLVYVTYKLTQTRKLKYFLQVRIRQIITASCVALILALPVFVINWNESGRLTPLFSGFQNSPFSIVSACVHSLISTASMLLGPIPDLYLNHSQDARKAVGDVYNNWINSHLLFWVTPDLHYSFEPIFYFDGVVSNAAYLGVGEVSVWLGFVPWLLVLILLLLLKKGNNQFQQIAFWLVVTFFAWHFTRCFMLKWVAGEGIYYAFSIALVAPAIASLWDYNSPDSIIKGVVIKGICIAVLITNLVSAINYFTFYYQRNLPSLLASHFKPQPNLMSQGLSQTIKSARRTMIVYNQWGLPFFTFMNENPNARYATTSFALPASPLPNFDLAFVLVENSDIPLQFENDDRSRLSFLGRYTTKIAFGNGPVVSRKSVQQTEEIKTPPKFAVLEINDRRNKNGGLTGIILNNIYGVDSDEEFLLSVTLVTPDKGVTRVLDKVAFVLKSPIYFPSAPTEGYLLIQLARRNQINIETHAWLPISLKQNWTNLNKHGQINFASDDPSGSYGFGSGWHPYSTDSYRWMSATTSEIYFPPLLGFNTCSIDFEMISRGGGDVYIDLNGKNLRKISLNDLKQARQYQLELPDFSISANINHLNFSIKRIGGAVDLDSSILGLNAFSINCRSFRGTRLY